MAIQKLNRQERNAQTKERNARRKELYQTLDFKKGYIIRRQIRKELHTL